jgi:hypothetical protein
MKLEARAQRFRREAEECRLIARAVSSAADRTSWLRLASDWARLARAAELNQSCFRDHRSSEHISVNDIWRGN